MKSEVENEFHKSKKYTELDFHEIEERLTGEIPEVLKHHIANVLSLIREVIEKLKISLILPKILENPKVLEQYLNNTKYEKCLQLVKEFRYKTKSDSGNEEPNEKNYYLLQMIDYFHENYQMFEVLPKWIDDIDNTEKKLLKCFEDIYQVATKRFQRSALDDLAREKRLHEVYLVNEEIKVQLKETTHKIQSQKLNRLWKTVAKSGLIKKLEEQLELGHRDQKLHVRNDMLQTHKDIQYIKFAAINKKEELKESLEKAKLEYEKTLNVDLLKEKDLRDESNKYQLQLLALTKKYDQVIYEKRKEEMFLKEEYNKEKQELENLRLVYNREDAIYEELVRKPRRKQQRKLDEQILLFTQNRAAKKIQRWWRTYLRAQKLLRKKLAKLEEKRKGRSKNKDGGKKEHRGNKKK